MSDQPTRVGSDLDVIAVGPDDPRLAALIALGDDNRTTLGFMPRAGFTDASARSHLIGAFHDDRLVGYTLFDTPRDHIRLVHLCVSPSARGTGVARALVDAVSKMHPGRLGIRLKCRQDYVANAVWPSLGFVATGLIKGRSDAGHLLTIWWKSHGIPDLFTGLAETTGAVQVAVDANVVSDLYSTRQRDGAQASRSLLPPWSAGDLDLVITPGVRQELNRTPDEAERNLLLRRAFDHGTHAPPDGAATSVVRQLRQAMPADAFVQDPSLTADANHLAEAIAAGADVFVSRDRQAVEHLAGPADSLFDFPVVHIAELTTFLDEYRQATLYRPRDLEQTQYKVNRTTAADYGNHDQLLSRPSGERMVELRRHLETLAAAATESTRRTTLRGPGGQIAAVWATSESNGALSVRLLRVVDAPLAPTIARQILHLLRRDARAAGLSVIELIDPHPSRVVIDAMHADGFRTPPSGHPTAMVMDRCLPWNSLRILVDHTLWPAAVAPGVPSAHDILELEHQWWPAKIADADVDCFIMPIRLGFAATLLAHRQTLFGRDDTLGMSREHVYYKSIFNAPTAPSRVLWYVSDPEMSVVAASRISEVVIDTPARLHRRFARLGVWDLPQVEQAARGRHSACAIHFGDTEVLDRDLPLDTVRDVLGKGPELTLRSATRITPAQFTSLWLKGRRQ